jgi:PAS domain S-box-containing protein
MSVVVLEAIKQFSLLLALLYLYTLFIPKVSAREHPWKRVGLQSLIFAFVAFVSMTISTPITVGHFSDSRSIIAAVAAAIGGPIPGFAAAIGATIARSLYPMGGFLNGTVSVVLCVVMGSLYLRLEQQGRVRGQLHELILFGLLMAVMKLTVLLTFGGAAGTRVFEAVAVPALFVYPAGFVVMYLMMRREERLNDETRRNAEYRNQFDVAIQSSPVGILIYRAADLVCVYANKMAARALETDIDMLVGNPSPLETDELTESMVNPIPFTLPNGMQRWFMLSSRPVRFEDENCLFVVIQDVTEQRQNQQQLVFSEARFRRFAEATSEGILMVTGGKIIDANQRTAELSGYAVDELVGQPIWHVVPDEERPVVEDVLARQSESAFTTAGLRKDGTRFPAEVMLRQVLLNGARMWLVTLRDLTERRQAETQRLALALEREKVRTLYDFIRATSHDLRTPLAVINTSLYLAQKTNEPQRLADQIRKAETQVSILSNILDRIYEWGQLSNIDQLPLSPVDINALLLNLQDRVSARVTARDLTLTLTLDPQLPPVNASVSDLNTALQSLLLNAITYTEPGGQVTLRTAVDGERVLVSVTDTGVGMTPEALARIFEPFYKADPARNSGDGVGLGLTIARRIIDLHGGTLTIESTPGTGTTACLWLERAEVQELVEA